MQIKTTLQRIAFTLCLIAVAPTLFATHSIGGYIAYKYLGDPDNDGLHTYEISMYTYQDCNSVNWFSTPGSQAFPIPLARIGIYEGGLNATTLTTAAPSRSLDLRLVDSGRVEVKVPSTCPSVSGAPCVYQVTYRARVDLPATFQGYHFIYDECCRSNAVTNVAVGGNTEGSAYHSWTSATAVGNSSPEFTDITVTFLCAGEQKSVLNTAKSEPDGNALTFKFAHPYNGQGTAGTYAGLHVGGYNPWPTNLATYNPGYSVNTPFGAGGTATINGFTGQSFYKSASVGNYVVSVEIDELNTNGNVVGRIRRDFLYSVLTCNQTNLNAPKLSGVGSSGTLNHTIEEGDSLCFDVTFFDPEGDRVDFNNSFVGSIFDANITSPAATIGAAVAGDSTITNEICWKTSCSQGRAIPYVFTATATDDGCLPRDTNIVYSITVNPFAGPSSIAGAIGVCSGERGVSYTTQSIANASYQWTVTGGTIASGQGTASITVDWGNGPGGNVRVIASNSFGCPSSPLDLSVLVNNFSINPGPDQTICTGDTTTIGSTSAMPTAPSGYFIRWSPSNTLSNDTVQNPLAFPNTTTTYVLTVTDSSGKCQMVDSVTVSTAGFPNAVVQNDTTICLGDPVTLSASGADKYTWTPGNVLNDSTLANPTANVTQTTKFLVKLEKTGFSCPIFDSVLVTVFNPNQIDAGRDTSVCMGSQLTLGGQPTAPANSRVLWSPNSNLNFDTLYNPTFTPTVVGNQQLIITATSPQGCVARDTVQVTIHPQANISISAVPNPICEGDSATLTGSGGLMYYWSTGDTSGSVKVGPTDTTDYYALGVNNNGCVDTGRLTLIVNPLPVIEMPDSLFLCDGDSMTLQATPGGSYVWTPNTDIINPNTATPTIHPSTDITYFVNVTSAQGCMNRDSVFVDVDVTVPTYAGGTVVVCHPDSALLGGNPTAPFNSTYAWRPSLGINDTTLANPSILKSTEGYVIVETQNGRCSGIDSVFVKVRTKPSVTVTPQSIDVCLGTSVQLDTIGTTGVINSMRWTPSDSLSNDTIPNPLANPIDTTFFILTVTDTNTCIARDTAVINVSTSPIVDLGPDTTICLNDSLRFSLPANLNYNWNQTTFLQDSGMGVFITKPERNIRYIVQGSNGFGCNASDTIIITVDSVPAMTISADTAICIGNLAQLSATGGTGISWTPTADVVNPNQYNTATQVLNATTTFTATVTSPLYRCPNYMKTTVTVNPIPTISAGVDTTVCLGASLRMNATGGTRYIWNSDSSLSNVNIGNPLASPTKQTTYVVRGFDAIGCTSTDTVEVDVLNPPIADAGPDIYTCGDTLVTLGGNPTGPANARYSWSSPALLNNPNIANPSTRYTIGQTFIVLVVDTNECYAIDSITVQEFAIETYPVVEHCRSDTTQLAVENVVGAAPFTFEWSPNEYISNTTDSLAYVSPIVSTLFNVTVSDTTGCKDSTSIEVFVNDQVTSGFSYTMRLTCEEMLMDIDSVTDNAASYEWYLDGELVSTDQYPKIPIAFEQDVTVDLVVESTDGCIDSLGKVETINDFKTYMDIDAPNVFTPNGDGLNDYFEIGGEQSYFECATLAVYNRWGQLVFASDGVNHRWDGYTFSGEPVTAGVYFFVFQIKDIEFKGSVTLVR